MKLVTPQTTFDPVTTIMREALAVQAIATAVDLNLFDFLEKTPCTSSSLAAQAGAIEEILEPTLDLLVAKDILEKNHTLFCNTDMASEFLVSTSPLYQGANISLLRAFNRMAENSMTQLITGKEVDRSTMDKSWALDNQMDSSAQHARSDGLPQVVEFVSQLPNADSFTTMSDIGGNHGLYTMGILSLLPTMHGTIFDLPHVIGKTQERCNKAGFESRITTHPIDIRTEAFPQSQFDLTVASHVLYAVKQNLSAALAKIANTLKPGGWFISHHFAGRKMKGKEGTKASVDLLASLCGYPSHFIEKAELIDSLTALNFHNFRVQPVSDTSLGMIIAAQKAIADT